MENIPAILDQITAHVSKEALAAALLFVAELAMRKAPTAKAWSILHAAKRFIRLLGNALLSLSKLLGAGADLMDKVLPQNVKVE